MNKRPLILSLLTLIILAISAMTMAQNSSSKELNSTYDLHVGEFLPENAINTYMVNVNESQIINLQILTLTGELITEYKVFDPQGSQLPIIQDTFDTEGNTRIAFPAAGQYRLEISNVSQSSGEYIVSTKMIRPYSIDSVFIPDNTNVLDSFDEEDIFHRYWFSTNNSEHPSTVIVHGEDFAPGIVATIRNLRSQEDIGVINTPAMASVYCIPAGLDNYAVDIAHDDTYEVGSYNITITSEPTTFCDEEAILALNDSLPTVSASELLNRVGDGAVSDNTDDNTTETVTDVIDGDVSNLVSEELSNAIPDVVCGASPKSSSDNINMRTLPSIAASVTAVVESDEILAIIGQTRNQSWLHVGLLDGRTGYASANVVDLAIACANVELPYIWTDMAQLLRLELEAGLIDIADIDADLLVGMDGIVLNADGTVASIAGLTVNGNINDDGITVDVNGTAAGTGVDANVTVDDGVNANVQVNDDPIVDVTVDDDGIDISLR